MQNYKTSNKMQVGKNTKFEYKQKQKNKIQNGKCTPAAELLMVLC